MYSRIRTLFLATLPVLLALSGLFAQKLMAAESAEIPLTTPLVVTLVENSSFTFSTANHHFITLDDALDAGDSVTLSVSSGVLTLAQTDGLTFSSGDGTADALMEMAGSSAEINAALNGLLYTPDSDFQGRDILSIVVGGVNSGSAETVIDVNASVDGEALRDALLAGVTTVHSGSQPGHVIAFGPTAWAIGQYDDGNTMLAATTWGQGRVVAMSDNQALEMVRYGDEGTTGQFYKNAIAWIGDTAALTSTIIAYDSDVVTWLTAQGYSNVSQTSTSALAVELDSAEIFIGMLGSSQTEANLAALSEFAINGGGLLVTDFGPGYDWWWGKEQYEGPGNQLLRAAGIGFGAGFEWDTGLITINRASDQVNAALMLEILEDETGYSENEIDEAGLLLTEIYEALPPGDPLLAQADEVFWARINTINPTPATPVSGALEQALLSRESAFLLTQDPFEVKAHRTVTDVYGAIPADTPRISKTVNIDTSRTRYQFTGLYAAPGDVVTVTLPAELVGKGYLIRLGTNTDSIAARDDWRRLPRIHRSFEIDSATVAVASAFGGSVIIDLGGNNYDDAANVGLQPIRVENAIEQPYFVLGQHSDAQWVDELRDKPAVRAVMVSDALVLTLPRSYTDIVTEPTALMTWWNDVVEGQGELVGRHEARSSAEIINVDIQNSAGAAHAGYPIQAWDIYWGNPADFTKVSQTGTWGDFHEIGHNHQRGWWTFSGDGEVSVNIFSNFNTKTDVVDPGDGWAGYSADAVKLITRAKSDVADGGTYSSKSNRWSFWFQLADVAGWDAYRCTFRSYEDDNATNPNALPTDETEERSQWMLRFSQCAGYDMTTYMVETWGLAVSEEALTATAALNLEPWLPVVGNIVDFPALSGVPVTVDIKTAAIAMDDIVTVTEVATPQNGTAILQPDGTMIYTSIPGFYGTDSFTYTLQSSVGNLMVYTGTIQVSEFYPCADPLVVSSTANDGACTLRQALTASANGDIVTFDERLEGRTIHLSSHLPVTASVAIDGGDSGFTISGDSDGDGSAETYIFDVANNLTVTLNRLNIVDGKSSTGAMIVRWSAHAIISSTTFANNETTFYGGGAIHAQGRISTYNSTFSGNKSSGDGAAVSIRGSGNYFYNSSFVDNEGSSTIGAGVGTGYELHNSLISGDSTLACADGAPTAGSHNLIFDDSCAIPSSTARLSPTFNLASLANNGGATMTHALMSGSDALNAGNPATCLSTDQRGQARSSTCDIGAYELATTPTSISLMKTATGSSTLLPILFISLILLVATLLPRLRSKHAFSISK